MFTIEHDFDATVITLVDEGDDSTSPLLEDVIIEAYEDCVVIRQVDLMSDEPVAITLSIAQLHDLAAALDAIAMSRGVDRNTFVVSVLDREVRRIAHEAIVLHRTLRGNRLRLDR